MLDECSKPPASRGCIHQTSTQTIRQYDYRYVAMRIIFISDAHSNSEIAGN